MSDNTNHQVTLAQFIEDTETYFSDIELPTSAESASQPLEDVFSYLNEVKEALEELSNSLAYLPDRPNISEAKTAISKLEEGSYSAIAEEHYCTIALVMEYIYTEIDFNAWYAKWEGSGLAQVEIHDHGVDVALAIEDAMTELSYQWENPETFAWLDVVTLWVEEVVTRELCISQNWLSDRSGRRKSLRHEAKMFILKLRSARKDAMNKAPAVCQKCNRPLEANQ